MKRRKTKAKRPVFGRMVEILADVALILVILAFGISIAARYNPERPAGGGAGGTRGGSERRATAPGRADQGSRPVPPPDRPAGQPPSRSLTVDIRNGCGRVGLAEDMMASLRRAGFDVVEYRNADRYDYPRTQIRDRCGCPEAGELRDWLRREYGVGELVPETVKSAGADVQLVLGSDLADTLRHRERRAR